MAITAEAFKVLRSNGGFGGAVGDLYTTGTADIELFDDVTASQQTLGSTEYRCFYIRYDGGNDAFDCSVWFDIGVDTGYIYITTGAFNAEAEHIGAPGTTPPAHTGVNTEITTVTSYTTGVSVGLTGTFQSGDYQAIWLKRLVPAQDPAKRAYSYTINWGGTVPV